MTERRFHICEIAHHTPSISEDWITESELRVRISRIIGIIMPEGWIITDDGWRDAIDILLNGEKRERDAWEKWLEQWPFPKGDSLYQWFRRMPREGK